MGTDTQLTSSMVNQDRIRILYTNSRESMLLLVAWVALIAVLLLFDGANVVGVMIWVMLLIIIQLFELRNLRDFFSFQIIRTPDVWERYKVMVSFAQAFVISTGTMLMMQLEQNVITYVTILFIILPAFASATTLATSVKSHYALLLGLLVPLAVKAALSEDPVFWILSGFVLFCAIPGSALVGKQMSGSFIDTLNLRFENEELLKTVQKERNIAEQERNRAEKANTDKSRFLAATSHDLRQPLHALDLFLGGLKNRLQIEENRTILGNAQASSRALGDLLNALLDVSRLDAGEVTVQKQILPLQPLLQESCNELYPVAQAKGLTLKLRCADNLYINTDAILFTRVLRNYILNAIRYTQQGTILVGVRKRGSDVRLEVWDTGRGIDDKQQKHIFDEYYQIDNPERDSEKGLGLGLAIVKRLSDLLGHPIGFKSELGRGSCFYITMPQALLVDYIEPEAKDLGDNIHDLTGLFVLVIDDHQSILDGMRNLLRDWDCEVLMGQSLDDIMGELKALDYPVPDVLLIDYRLRENKTGDVAIQTIRTFFDSDIPAVLMTGEVGHDMETLAYDTDAKLVHKPLPVDDLKALLQQFVKPQG